MSSPWEDSLSYQDEELKVDREIAKAMQEEEEKAALEQNDQLFALQETDWEPPQPKTQLSEDEALAISLQSEEMDKQQGTDSVMVRLQQDESLPPTEQNDYQYAASLQEDEDRRVAKALEEQFKRENKEQKQQRDQNRQRQSQNHSVPSFLQLSQQHSPGDGAQLEACILRRMQERMTQLYDTSDQRDNYEANLELAERLGDVGQGLKEEEIQTLPTTRFSAQLQDGAAAAAAAAASSTDSDGKECKVCYVDFDEGENIRMLPCLHKYHVVCIDQWISEKPTCPICRINIREEMKKDISTLT